MIVTPERRILALDPATTTGYAHSNGQHGEWKLGKGDSRGEELRDWIIATARAWGCDLIAYELASFGAGASGKRKIQWSVIVLHNELRGAIKGAAAKLGVEAWGYHPSTIKKETTCSGRASKEQMIAAVKLLYGVETDSDNVADAVAILEMAKRGVLPSAERKKREKKAIKEAAKRQRGSSAQKNTGFARNFFASVDDNET